MRAPRYDAAGWIVGQSSKDAQDVFLSADKYLPIAAAAETNRFSRAYEAGVQTAGNTGIGGALDDGATIRKQGHLQRIPVELQDKLVISHGSVGEEARAHRGEVDGAVAFVDLDGV